TEDTGSNNADFITTDTTLVVSGTFDNVNGNNINVTIGGVLYTPSITGNAWSIDLQDTSLSDGNYELIATISDPAGNTSTATQNIVVDTGNNGDDGTGTGLNGKDAVISLNEISDNYINAQEADGEIISITGTSTALNGNIVSIRVDGILFGTTEVIDGEFSLDIPAGTFALYADGTYIVSAEVSADLAGNLATDSENVILDRDVNGDDGTGTGIGGKDAVISLDEISDNFINKSESEGSIRVTGTTTALEGTVIVVSFNGVSYETTALADFTFGVDIVVGDVVDGSTMLVDASVVADTAGNLSTTSEDVIIDLSAGILSSISASVNESALDIGTNPSLDGRSVSGNILEGQGSTDGSSISGLSLAGQAAIVWEENSDILVITTDEGSLYLATAQTIQDGITYNEGDYLYILENAGSNTQDAFTFTLTDDAGNSSSSDLNISIVDDVAISGQSGDKYLNADASHTNVTNLVLTLDVSGSMAWDAEGHRPTGSSFDPDTVRIDLAKEALTNLINTYAEQGDVNVKVVAFESSAIASEWLSAADAISYINSLTAEGGTMYDEAISNVESITGAPESDDSFFYFISDGEPNDGGALSSGEQSTWETYADANYDKTFAIGMGTRVDLASLQAIGGAADTQVISSATDLDAALLSTISSVTGSLLGFDVDGTVISLGADGGRIDSVEIDGITYSYDLYNNQDITTSNDGIFVINFDTGSYSYTVGINAQTEGQVENLHINAMSTDGESVSGDLVLHLEETPDQNLSYDLAGLDGGVGFDTLVLHGTEFIDFANVDNIKNIESIDLTTGDNNLLNISAADVLEMTDSNNTLTILGDESDSVSLKDSTEWTQTQTTEDGHNFTVYSSAEDYSVILKIETEIPVI
ncbi:MAG TPA: VWA domain-containing protein, partial [Sulfurimonas sp.]|nr:VWA domain-containing protein [Sulfurimonas sp.]